MNANLLIATVLLCGGFLSVKAGKLTFAGGLTGCIIGWFVFAGVGVAGLVMLASFFILATFATSIGIDSKVQLGLIEDSKAPRTASQVFANAGLAGIIGFLMLYFPQYVVVCRWMMGACFASATSDTLSSEIGNAYGTKFYNILSLKKDKRGDNGVISLEGSVAGLAGTICIAIEYFFYYGSMLQALFIVFTGTAGNFTDSILSATLERRKLIGNDTVNFLNTATAAFIVLLLFLLQ